MGCEVRDRRALFQNPSPTGDKACTETTPGMHRHVLMDVSHGQHVLTGQGTLKALTSTVQPAQRPVSKPSQQGFQVSAAGLDKHPSTP